MLRGLIGILVAAADGNLRGFLRAVAATTAGVLCAAISLAFGTFAAYVYLRALEGPIVAALIVSAGYGLLAIAIWAIGAVCRRAGRAPRAVAAAAPPSRGNVASTQYLAASGATQDQQRAIAEMLLVRDLSAAQLLALGLAAGFIAGRRIGKSGFARRRSGGPS